MCIHTHDSQNLPLKADCQHCITSSLKLCIVKFAVNTKGDACKDLFLVYDFFASPTASPQKESTAKR